MTLHELTDEFLLYLGAVRGLSENTVKGYGNDLALLQEFLEFCADDQVSVSAVDSKAVNRMILTEPTELLLPDAKINRCLRYCHRVLFCDCCFFFFHCHLSFRTTGTGSPA